MEDLKKEDLQIWMISFLNCSSNVVVMSGNVVVSASILKTKAKKLAGKISIKGFQASDGWLHHWKSRYNVSFKTISGEGNSCTTKMTTPWKETTIPTILSKCKLDKIYNADNPGFLFRMKPRGLRRAKTQ